MSALVLLAMSIRDVGPETCNHGCVCQKGVEGRRHSQVMTVVDRSSVEAVAPPPEYIVKEYTMPAPSACIFTALGGPGISAGAMRSTFVGFSKL
jgi:hypothetical protein